MNPRRHMYSLNKRLVVVAATAVLFLVILMRSIAIAAAEGETQVIVKVKPNADPKILNEIRLSIGAKTSLDLPKLGVVILTVTGRSYKDIIPKIQADPRVEYIESTTGKLNSLFSPSLGQLRDLTPAQNQQIAAI